VANVRCHFAFRVPAPESFLVSGEPVSFSPIHQGEILLKKKGGQEVGHAYPSRYG
jgi:hypothetical protein